MTGTRIVVVTALATLLSTYAGAEKKREVIPTDADRMATHAAKSGVLHPLPANTKAGATLGKERHRDPGDHGPGHNPFPTGPRYPADLTYQGGETVGQTKYHAIYLLNSFTGTTGCTESTIASCLVYPVDNF